MSVAVVGCGRSGTNITTEMLRGSPDLKGTHQEEDKRLFTRHEKYAAQYLGKCDTHYITLSDIEITAKMNPRMFVAWAIRDPRDMAMSKLRRGVPIKQGGDCPTIADDATTEGCVADIRKMSWLYVKSKEIFGNRLLLVRMEETLQSPEMQALRLCRAFGIRFHHTMPAFYLRMRNKHKRKRYGNRIDLSQVGMWKRWKSAYGGWLEKNNMPIEMLFKLLQPEIDMFGYGHGQKEED